MSGSLRHHPYWPKLLVSSLGEIISYRRGSFKTLTSSDNGSGYLRVGVGHANPRYVHILVAETFVPNDDPEQKIEVNHIDGDKNNNAWFNLEWMTPSENDLHAFATGLKRPSNERPVRVVETGVIYPSQAECARAISGIQGNIALCLTKRRNTHRGFHFEYVDREDSNV